ncbi:Arylsulfatase [Pontiella desulfatans]|uniref:Arylsulfatase n=2 Tax=Pontiella desulfatans TaxID=2750659 RepID=A0A6C2U8G7_PONDE|nr:sulfatase S1_15 [Kiritimatiellales bacterium]VGO16350.1 Arylsulfatase [Pontiella desulfatans]
MLLMAGGVYALKPNVVIIYGDDVGYGDVGAYGSKLIPTPNIDRLAAEGLRFTDGHCSAGTCTPSRYSLLTGVHGFRHGVAVLPPNAPLTISTEAFTLPELFRQAGYTAGVVGKWHLGIGAKGTPVDWNGEVKPGPLEIDFISSFAALLEEEVPAGEALDSRNMLGALLGKDPDGLPFMIEEAEKRRALRRGDWKYISASKGKKNRGGGPAELYNLKNDPGETRNVIADFPEKAAAMQAELRQLIEQKGIRK